MAPGICAVMPCAVLLLEHAARLANPSRDPAFAAAQALDLAGEAHAAVHRPYAEILAALDPRGVRDWGDPAAVARAALGRAADGTVRALAAYGERLAALDGELAEAEELFRSTRAMSELGAAAMRAAARRHAAAAPALSVRHREQLHATG